ncbi:hypothetical protein KQI91_13930 [Blautia sp. MSJ-19]|nr:hypothetical protein [Blautia sp. MSJ-19]
MPKKEMIEEKRYRYFIEKNSHENLYLFLFHHHVIDKNYYIFHGKVIFFITFYHAIIISMKILSQNAEGRMRR